MRDRPGEENDAARVARALPEAPRRKSGGVMNVLGGRIVAGEIANGAFLPTEAELVAQFGVSRPSLREALWMLARKGLIEARARRGTRVLDRAHWDLIDPDVLRWMEAAPPDPAFLIGLLEVRTFIEPEAARLAAMRATPGELDRIRDAYNGMVASLPHDPEACCHHDLAFHENIMNAAHNIVLRRLAAAIRTALLVLFKTSSAKRESYENSLAEHGAVAVAIGNRDPAGAMSAMRALLAGTARDLEPALGPSSAGPLSAVAGAAPGMTDKAARPAGAGGRKTR
jgi:DNA-binding FadR family transcriptional regulator